MQCNTYNISCTSVGDGGSANDGAVHDSSTGVMESAASAVLNRSSGKYLKLTYYIIASYGLGSNYRIYSHHSISLYYFIPSLCPSLPPFFFPLLVSSSASFCSSSLLPLPPTLLIEQRKVSTVFHPHDDAVNLLPQSTFHQKLYVASERMARQFSALTSKTEDFLIKKKVPVKRLVS